jgi:hypothetical protein
MSVRTGDDETRYQTVETDAADLQRYAAVTLEDGEVIIYDQDNESAWIQSESAIGLEFMA